MNKAISTRWEGLGSESCPIGVCLLAMGGAMWGAFAFVFIVTLQIAPPDCHNCYTVWDIGAAPYLLGLVALPVLTAMGLYLGSRLARLGFVLALSGHVLAIFLLEGFPTLRFIFRDYPQDRWSVGVWWYSLWPSLALASVVAAVCWYLFGPRTAAHFRSSEVKNA